LLCDDFDEAAKKAAELEEVNDRRRAIEAELVETAMEQAGKSYAGQRALVVSGDGWHEGVKGIVASRLVRTFGVPVILFTIDEDGAAIQSMRSGIMVRPGETNACVGCHESRLDAPTSAQLAGAAESGTPIELTPPVGGVKLYSYMEDVQPVFDKYCVTCHDFDTAAPNAPILARDRNPAFNASYWSLREGGFVRVAGPGPHNTLEPYTWGARASRLGKVLFEGHPKPEIDAKRRELGLYLDKTTDPEAFGRVVLWMDINAPYYPTYGSAYRDNLHGRSPLNYPEWNRLQELTGKKGNALTVGVSFDRPEVSPCLKAFDSKDSAEYKEALAILQTGQARLAEKDRGEDSNFAPVADVEIDQQKRYEYFQKRAALVRNALQSGKTLNDLEIDAALGDTWR
ncbi:MAG: hypothetical protein HUK22_03080, partial [Thermoguttaceae bacterium]|nr:hypothetical protein [Thermoguttaceae bacterium]